MSWNISISPKISIENVLKRVNEKFLSFEEKTHLMNSCNDANFWNRTFNVKLLCSINFTHQDNLFPNILDPISDYKRNIISVDCTFPFLIFCKMAQNAKKVVGSDYVH